VPIKSLVFALLLVLLDYFFRGSRQQYHSVVTQSFNYFSRPHSGILKNPEDIESLKEGIWYGAELEHETDKWLYRLNPIQVKEILSALEVATERLAVLGSRDLEVSDEILGQLTKDDFPLPTLEYEIQKVWMKHIGLQPNSNETAAQVGFLVVRGLPIQQLSITQAETVFWCLGLYMGVPGAQNNNGDLLGHVKDIGGDPKRDRQFKTSAFIDWHCDAADIVGLMCIQKPLEGGESSLASTVTVYNELVKLGDWETIRTLYEPVLLDTRGSGGVNYVRIPPIRNFQGNLQTFYHKEYFQSAYRHLDAPVEMPYSHSKALSRYNAILGKSKLKISMSLELGDMQFVNNHRMVHSRTEYTDGDTEEAKRHLLRLWITSPATRSTEEVLLKGLSFCQVLFEFVAAKIRSRIY